MIAYGTDGAKIGLSTFVS